MQRLQATPLEITPFFDLETFMLLSGQKRIDGNTAEAVEKDWHRLYSRLWGYRLGEPESGYLVILLDRDFDQELEKAREEDRDRAERLELIAQSMIMAALFEVLPESAEQGCAPVPEPSSVLEESLAQLGLSFRSDGHLDVSFGLVTGLPYFADCESCHAKSGCSKRLISSAEKS